MGVEIERKFLVEGDAWMDGSPGCRIAQGYLTMDPERTVRVRRSGDRAWLTIKGRGEGIRRAEFEYSIPVDEAAELLEMCLPSVIDKTRYRISHRGRCWEVDVFHGVHQGLVLAEVELESENEVVDVPEWAAMEVSHDPRFFNSSLARVSSPPSIDA